MIEKQQFSLDTISNDVIMATFVGLCRTKDELIYFDKLNGEVLSYVEGYFSSIIGDQKIKNSELLKRITLGDESDFIDENRYILIDRLPLTEFLREYKKQTNNKEPFFSFDNYFKAEMLKEFEYYNDLTIDQLAFTEVTFDKFHEIFHKKYATNILEYSNDYERIFDSTCNTLALTWIKNQFS